MTARERFKRMMAFQRVDRLPCFDFGYWKETIRRWHGEGLPPEVTDQGQVEAFLELDRGPFDNHLPICPYVSKSVIYPLFEAKTIEETGNTITWINEHGVLLKELKSTRTMPQWLHFPVSDRRDFEKLLPRLNGNDPERYPSNWEELKTRARDGGEPVGFAVPGFLGFGRSLMGLEGFCLALHDDPELILRMNAHACRFIKEVSARAVRELSIDFVTIWEDMCYNYGMLVSPDSFRRFMAPFYEEIVEWFHSKGILVVVDSDGKANELVPLLRQAGVDGLYPCEIRAGTDLYKIRKENPGFVLIGGFDKFALMDGPRAIDVELSRLRPLAQEGRYVPTVDHRVPPEVPFDNYRYYVGKRRDLAESCGAGGTS